MSLSFDGMLLGLFATIVPLLDSDVTVSTKLVYFIC